jgi:folate-binding protein YgfZ
MTPPDYDAAISGAALFDDSAVGKLILRGPDAPMFLGNLSTNDIAPLPLGGGCATYFCDARAKALFQAAVYHARLDDAPHALWLETTAGRDLALLQHLDRYLISEAVEFENATERFGQLHLAGPQAKAILESALTVELPDLQEFQHIERTFGHQSAASLRRRNRLGLPGFDIVCLRERAEGISRMLLAAGATAGTPETREILRIEAGSAEYGKDFDESRFVMEILGAKEAVSYSKGCYLGQEPIVMSRDRAGHAPRSMVKLRSEVPLTAGSKLFQGSDEIGTVTSTTVSPRFGPIALGIVKWKYRDEGTALEAESGSARIGVTVRP